MKTIMTCWRRSVLAALVVVGIAAIGPSPAAAQTVAAQTVAMVTDIEGGNSVTGMGESTEISLLAELEPGGGIDLAAGARLVIVYYESGNEFVFTGPASIRIGPVAPELLSGNDPEERQVMLAGIIQPAGMIQASIVMRGTADNIDIRLENLVDTKTLDTRPLFRWKPLPGVTTYQFEIIDDSGDSLAEAEVTATELWLPEAVTLEVGVIYTWEVAARTPDGILHSGWGDFSLATDADRALVEQMRPPADAPFSSRVMFAVVLQQLELRDEAQTFWQSLLAERIDDPALRQMAGQ